MENHKKIVFKDEDFESYKLENIGVMKIKRNVFEIVTDLSESSKFIQSLSVVEKDINIDGILVLNENNCLGANEYTNYLNKVFSHDGSDTKRTHLEISNPETRTRQLVILNSLIRKIVHSNKIIINALHGEIVTPFFGASLAADLRLASEDAVFLLSHSKMGVHPSGALPYFLPKYVGHAKASHILFCVDKITAKEALDLEIICEIIPKENFEEMCVAKVSQLLARGSNTMKCTKKLLANNYEDIDKYLNMEECNFCEGESITKIIKKYP